MSSRTLHPVTVDNAMVPEVRGNASVQVSNRNTSVAPATTAPSVTQNAAPTSNAFEVPHMLPPRAVLIPTAVCKRRMKDSDRPGVPTGTTVSARALFNRLYQQRMGRMSSEIEDGFPIYSEMANAIKDDVRMFLYQRLDIERGVRTYTSIKNELPCQLSNLKRRLMDTYPVLATAQKGWIMDYFIKEAIQRDKKAATEALKRKKKGENAVPLCNRNANHEQEAPTQGHARPEYNSQVNRNASGGNESWKAGSAAFLLSDNDDEQVHKKGGARQTRAADRRLPSRDGVERNAQKLGESGVNEKIPQDLGIVRGAVPGASRARHATKPRKNGGIARRATSTLVNELRESEAEWSEGESNENLRERRGKVHAIQESDSNAQRDDLALDGEDGRTSGRKRRAPIGKKQPRNVLRHKLVHSPDQSEREVSTMNAIEDNHSLDDERHSFVAQKHFAVLSKTNSATARGKRSGKPKRRSRHANN